ncbi:MAG TPA: hypothetical protein ENG01_00950, partial [Candidatus Aenigmarchaeota archaeon]|nr:hypothetical protein [Candidatus Aenigmarchaeota archaeon]HEX32963.1 hypothetical protein [Candidatus Aenigmarchaeota archaeon]
MPHRLDIPPLIKDKMEAEYKMLVADGLTPFQACNRLSKKYGINPNTIRYWFDEKYRKETLERTRRRRERLKRARKEYIRVIYSNIISQYRRGRLKTYHGIPIWVFTKFPEDIALKMVEYLYERHYQIKIVSFLRKHGGMYITDIEKEEELKKMGLYETDEVEVIEFKITSPEEAVYLDVLANKVIVYLKSRTKSTMRKIA